PSPTTSSASVRAPRYNPHALHSALCRFLFYCSAAPRHLHSFPTRRSSDLRQPARLAATPASRRNLSRGPSCRRLWETPASLTNADRKSTRLNSSHLVISYAVFCLKKKTRVALARAEPSAVAAETLLGRACV